MVGSDYILGRDQLYFKLKSHGILSRRYFYPLIPDYQAYKNIVVDSNIKTAFPNAHAASESVLCIPIHAEMDNEDIQLVIKVMNHGS